NFRTSVSMDNVYVLPEYQNEYAGGYTQDFIDVVDPVDGQTYKRLNYSADESWGPRMDGTMYRPWYSWYPGTADYGLEIPLVPAEDNVKDFFETGITNTNSLDLQGGNQDVGFRLGFTNMNQSSVIPNSTFNRNSAALNAYYNITPALKAEVNLT